MWDVSEKVAGNRNMTSMFAVEEFTNDPRNIRRLAYGPPLTDVAYRLGGRPYSLNDYVRRQNVTGLLVVKDRSVVLEHYGFGNTEETRWTSWSVGKSVMSTLVGVALQEGRIPSLDALVTDHVAELRGGAYDGVTMRHMLQMSSGVRWSENPGDPAPNVADFARCLAEQRPGSILAIAKQLPRAIDPATGMAAKPGVIWNYSNVDAFVTGVALQRAIGRSLAKYLEEKIWKPCGMERSGFWMSESPGGLNSGAGDFSATLRDYGRLAQFILDDGVLADGTRSLPQGWMSEATTWRPRSADGASPGTSSGGYGYLWWRLPVPPGLGVAPETTSTSSATFTAVGLFGQYIFINPVEKLIMIQWSAYPEPEIYAPAVESAAFFNAISDALN